MQEVAAGGNYILGPHVAAFEDEVASYSRCKYAVGVGNGTDALHLVLRALNIGPGDEVVTTPFTFIATTEAIGMVGATPVFADINPETFNIQPEAIEAAITPATKAIIPVHLYGQPCQMDAIVNLARKYGLRIVEDCAQAFGATYRGQAVGTIGDVGCLSFFPSKSLGALGDAGMVITNDETVYRRVEMLRRHGGRVKYYHEELGLNSRLDELQAAVLRVKFKHLDRWNELRRERAYLYNAKLDDRPDIQRPCERSYGKLVVPSVSDTSSESYAVYHQYTVRVAGRDDVLAALKNAGIECAVYYPVPLHLQRVHRKLNLPAGSFPHSEAAAGECLSLPMFPELSEQEQEQVVRALKTHCRVALT